MRNHRYGQRISGVPTRLWTPCRGAPVTETLRRATCLRFLLTLGCAVALLGRTTVLAADVKPIDEPREVTGALVICGGGQLPEAVRDRFRELAGGNRARIVVIPTASESADGPNAGKALEPWKKGNPASLVWLHTRSREKANDPSFVAPLKEATGVWFGGGDQSRIADAYLGTAVETEIRQLLARGGVVGGTSAGAAIQSRLMITGGNPKATTGVGFDLLPGAVVDQHFLRRNRKPRLLGVLKAHPGFVGFGIDEGTALIVHGRSLEVVGTSSVTVCLEAVGHLPRREVVLAAGQKDDLFRWQRAAIERRRGFPPATWPEPEVAGSGTLVIVGGGAAGESIRRFLDAAGGRDAPIVFLPTAQPDPLPERLGELNLLRRAGATRVTVLPSRERSDVESARYLEAIRTAKGIWFGGGRQWRFVDAYADTKALAAFHEALKNGAVIGGSSAGASIQADYLVRGNPMGNRDMMVEGYERGFGFLRGVAIDQHFTQRNRQGDLAALLKAHPKLIGLGIDEATAVVAKGTQLDVIGKHTVTILYTQGDPPREQRVVLKAGDRYDLIRKQATALSSAGAAGR